MIRTRSQSKEEAVLRSRGYTIDKVIGEGSYSKVKSAKWKRPDSDKVLSVAIKIINKSTAPQEFLDKFWPRERSVMETMNHKNIVRMYEIFQQGNKIYMSLERAPRGDLLDYIRLKGPLKDNEARLYFNDMCAGIRYIHDIGIIHRDLKCENLLLFERQTLKIADFGFARRISRYEQSGTFCGSAAYAAPELLKGEPYDGPVADCWSIGVILFIITCARMPFSDGSIRELVEQQAKRIKFPTKRKIDGDVIDLINNTLNFDLKSRYRLKQIQAHRWTTANVLRQPFATLAQAAPVAQASPPAPTPMRSKRQRESTDSGVPSEEFDDIFPPEPEADVLPPAVQSSHAS